MPRMGLTKEIIVKSAIALIEEEGYHIFSMRELADRCGVKTASLYNHIENMDAVMAEVGRYAVDALVEAQLAASADLVGDEAVFALAMAYRTFAKTHPELYKVIMDLHKTGGARKEAAHNIPLPFLQVFGEYPLTEQEKMHWQRVLRSIMHGFLAQEEAGYFSHFPIVEEDSYQMAIRCFIDGLHVAIKRKARNENKR